MRARFLAIAALGTLLAVVPIAGAAPILDAGWEVDADIGASDRILAANTDSEDSPYLYNLATPAFFRITDQFNVGDTFEVFDFGVSILTTQFVGAASGFGDNAVADAGWTSANFGSGEVILLPGAHLLTIQGDGVGGLPARFFVRIDTVPEPASLVLLGLGLGCISVIARRRRRA